MSNSKNSNNQLSINIDKAVKTTEAKVSRVYITWPEPGKLRVRKVVTRSRARSTGKYPSWKMGRMVEFESKNELKVLRLLDVATNVIAFSEQPLTIHYWLDGIKHIHYPDLLVEFTNHKELWEVKDNTQTDEPELLNRTIYLSTEMLHFGYRYRVVKPDELATKTHHSLVKTILQYGRSAISEHERESVRRILSSVGKITWGAAEKGVLGRNGRNLICRLVLEGVLSFDIKQSLSSGTAFMWVTSKTQGGV